MQCTRAEERVGTLLAGRYRLEGILGEGGQAVVYRATHAWTGRSVAVKLLRPEHARDRHLVMRFLREARTASTLVHPNVVAILDMGADEDGDVHLAMELVEGRSLGAILDREQRLEPSRAITLLRPIVDALALAHRSGIVHRDIKPDNILIGDRGDGVVRPILLDFGTAKSTTSTWGNATQVGAIIGTPFYMSPEQTEGAADVGPPSDVWSMGVLLYRCLSGSLPFFASSPSSLLLAIIRGEHEPLDRVAPWVPRPIASVVERALCTDRAQRYADAGELLEALDRAMVERGVVDGGVLAGTDRASTARAVPDGSVVDRAAASGDSVRGLSSIDAAAGTLRRASRSRRVIAAVATAATLAFTMVLGSMMALGAGADVVASDPDRAGVTEPESIPAPLSTLPAGIDPPPAPDPGRVADLARDVEATTALVSALPITRRTPAAAIAGGAPVVVARATDAGEVLPAIGSAGDIATTRPRERGHALARSFEESERNDRRVGLAREW
jgi:tRNA A-37 threonylcarbamoyl transferase component Bud32